MNDWQTKSWEKNKSGKSYRTIPEEDKGVLRFFFQEGYVNMLS